MIIETQRLLIRPLTFDQLRKYAKDGGELEKELQLKVHPRVIVPELADAIQQMIEAALANPNNEILFFTLWTITDKEKQVMVGDLCFKGPPTEKGEVEVGYGTHEAFWNQGYMTEALQAVVRWARSRDDIHTILAETDQANGASGRTLTKNNFDPFKQEGGMIWWRLPLKS